MKLEEILEAAKRWNPEKILTQPDEEYITLKEGEVVVDYNDELMMSYDGNGTWQISYGDWIGNYENPMPTIDLIMNGYLNPEYVDGQVKLVMADDENRNMNCVEAMQEALENEYMNRLHQSASDLTQA